MPNRGFAPEEQSAPGYAAAPPPASQGGRWRLRNWHLRYKMAAVLLVPTIAALGVGGVRVYDGLVQAHQLSTLVEQVNLAQRASNVVQTLETERDDAVVMTTTGGPAALDAYKTQQAQVDSAVQQLDSAQSQLGDFAPSVRQAYSSANEWLDGLSALRNTINQGFTEPAALTTYNSIIGSVLDINRETANAAGNTQVNRTAQAAESISVAKEDLAQERSLLLGAALHGSFLSDQADQLRSVNAQFQAALVQFQSVATPAQQQLYSARVAGPNVDATSRVEQAALLADESGRPLGVNPQEWSADSTANLQLVNSVQQQLLSEFHDSVQQDASSAWWAAIRDGALIIAFLLVAIGFATYIARSMLRPLRTLQYGALEIAQKELPDAIRQVNDNPASLSAVRVAPVPVHTNEEVGQVARSFDAVHQEALRLASEQALLRNNVNDLFVNLARRSQTLVQRQLSLIDRLEQDEQDPDQLSSLFELDHLATRMRRNNENLLILGGTDLTRRTMRPEPLAEVIGAAVSEVEQYARVVVADSPDLAIQGRVVNDFVHLVAELLENATVFSNPDTEVTVRTAYRRQELVLEIRDRGVGIDSEELAEINERLVRPPSIDVAVSRRMGLYVVGQLARRHEIRVQLENSEDMEGGVVATVRLSGNHVVQLTPSGPIPMPDIPRGGLEDARDPVRDSGAHTGLAAAFRRDQADLGRQRPMPPPSREDPVAEPAAEERPAAEPTESFYDQRYSVHVASSDSFGASDVPEWPERQRAPEYEFSPAADESNQVPDEWANDETMLLEPSTVDRIVGAHRIAGDWDMAPGFDTPGNLFENPYEAEKDTQFQERGDAGWSTGIEEPMAASTASGSNGFSVNHSEGGALGHSAMDSADQDMDDAPTQRLPIYEAVLSQWFRESDEDDDLAGSARGPVSSTPDFANGETRDVGERPDPPAAQEKPDNQAFDGAHSAHGATLDQTDATGRIPAGNHRDHGGDETAYDPGWGFADYGWQAAEALVEQSQEQQEMTSAGLPKRVPKSKLVPGSAVLPSAQSETPSKSARSRSADDVRGRMSNFQQGVRRGRHAKAEVASTEQSGSIPSSHEEQE